MQSSTIIFILFLILNFNNLFAQKSGLGIKAGINLVTIKFSQNGETHTPDRATKPHIGLLYNHFITENFAFQPELLYSGYGYEPETDFTDIVDLHYIALPLLFKYYPHPSINLQIGPVVSLLFGGTEVNDIRIVEQTTSVNLAYSFGLEYLVTENFGVTGRFVGGLIDVETFFDELDIKTNNIQISLSYYFTEKSD